jgi:hypothetical protein
MNEDFDAGSSAIQALTESIKALIQANKDAEDAAKARAEGDKEAAAKAKEKAAEDKKDRESKAKLKASAEKAADSLIKLGKEVLAVAEAGVKLSTTIGTNVTRGVQTELNNRTTIFNSIFSLERDRIVSSEQLIAAESSLASTFMGAAEGMDISSKGVRDFNAALKGGFNSDFKLTGESMKALITAGVSTEAGFESLRKASGRRALSDTQLATLVNKNSLSFMLYGPRFAKAAQEAEKLGISLSSVQSAQESMVTNLDGTLDTLNQLNQIGANIDFGTLTRLNETQGPEATLKYLQSTIPPALFQSASTRALLKGFGISVEDLMKKQGSVQDQAASNIEASLTKLEEPVGNISKILTEVVVRLRAFNESWGPLIKGVGAVAIGLYGLYKGFGLLAGTMALFKAMTDQSLGTSFLDRMITGMGAGGSATAVAGATPGAAPGGGGAAGAGSSVGFMEKLDAKKLVAGAAAMLIAAAALYVVAKAIQQFKNIDLKQMGMAGLALLGLTGAVIALGAVITNPLGATAMIAGAAAMVIIGGALYIVAKALQVAGAAMVLFGPALASFGAGLSTIDAGKMAAIGAAAIPFAAGLVALTLVALPASVGLSLLANRLANFGTGATAIQTLADSFVNLANALDRISGVDTGKIKDLSNIATNVPANARVVATGAGGDAGGNPVLIKKIDELVSMLKEAKTTINIDNRQEQVPRVAMTGVTLRNDRG